METYKYSPHPESDSPQNDTQISIEGLKEGNPDDWEMLNDQYRKRLINSAIRKGVPVDLAEDVIQEAFIALFQGIDNVDHTPEILLQNNVGFAAINLHRKMYGTTAKRLPPLSMDQLTDNDENETINPEILADESCDPEVIGIHNVMMESVIPAIEQLKPDQQEVILCDFRDGLSLSECAARYNIPRATVTSRISRGLKKLGEILGSPNSSENSLSLDKA